MFRQKDVLDLASKIMAHAVKELFPSAKLANSGINREMFYYDFSIERPFSEIDIKSIDQRIKRILKRCESLEIVPVSKEEAISVMKDRKEPYKVKLIEEQENDSAFILKHGDFVDIIDQKILMKINQIKAVKVLSSSAAYWKGDMKNESLQRIYGIAFQSEDEMQKYLEKIESMKSRDHRKLGRELELFCFMDSAPGMPYWLPKGWILYNNLIDFWRKEHKKLGYLEFSAPQVNNSQLWKQSGHWEHYKKDMYILHDGDGNEQALKPMSCPNAIMIYKMKQRSYKELPLRLSDVDVIHRNEKSGQLNGLLRTRMFRQDDSHNFISESQIGSEIKNILKIADMFYQAFGLEYVASLSTRPDDFMGDIEIWDKAEKELKEVLDSLYGAENYPIKEKDGAFYGPKIDIQMKDCLGREWQMGTVQLDFQLPIKFDLEFVNSEGKKERPIIIHRVILGSLERFIGLILEHFAGELPLWIAPVQVRIIPISESCKEYANKVNEKLEEHEIRSEVDVRNEKLGYKIYDTRLQKIPYTIVVGNQEQLDETISVRRLHGEKKSEKMSTEEFINLLNDKISQKK
jgi:threonine--tRNA ligase